MGNHGDGGHKKCCAILDYKMMFQRIPHNCSRLKGLAIHFIGETGWTMAMSS